MAGKARVYFEVACPIHGTTEAKNVQTFRRVVVAAPRKGFGRHQGCHLCRKTQ